MQPHRFALIYCLLTIWCTAGKSGSDVPLNPHATLLEEVASVQHDETSRNVVIQLAENRRCAQPTFMVRLSGTSLYLLDLVRSNHSKPDTVTFTYPHLDEAGMYFLEVLTMYCEAFDPSAVAKTCLVHPDGGRNILTLPYSFNSNGSSKSVHRRPRWVLSRNATPALLPTRAQKMCGNTYCISVEEEIAQHNQYSWTDGPPYKHLVQAAFEKADARLTTRTGNETLSICMVGASHARAIVHHGNALNVPHVTFRHILSRYPVQFDVLDLEDCTFAVIGYGQWPLSAWMNGQPYTGTKYEAEMRKVLQIVTSTKLSTQVVARSMNLNGLGYLYTMCPSKDLRHPTIVMMYNEIMAKVSREYKVPFIDLFHLQGPMWDIALDWSHPYGRVLFAEAEFIIHSVLSHAHDHHRVLVLDPNPAGRAVYQRPAPHVKFTNNLDTLYELKRGVLRPYPTLAAMNKVGVEWDDVLVIDANAHADYVFGAVLPEP